MWSCNGRGYIIGRGYVEQGHAALKDEPQETQYNLSTALRAMVRADTLVYQARLLPTHLSWSVLL